jgi:SAM-dependent methyltransferase
VNVEFCVDFPGTAFRSIEDFKRFRADNRDLFDEQYRREQALGIEGPKLTRSGVCGPCLRVTQFTSPTHGGEATADGRLVPHWRLAQSCGCPYALTSHERALVHMALSRLGSPSWYHAGVLGRGDRLAKYINRWHPDFALWPRVLRESAGDLTLPVMPGSQHMVLAADELPHFPPLDAVLAAVARCLTPGGIFIFTTPFDVELTETISSAAVDIHLGSEQPPFSSDPVHRLGWDLIGRLRDAGFSDAVGYCYWSEEFGYLGSYNMIFLAFR